MQVRITSYINLTTQNDANSPENVANVSVDLQMTSHTYGVAPNTRYEVDIGAEAGPPCTGQFPTSWSEIERVGCTTPPSSEYLLGGMQQTPFLVDLKPKLKLA